MALLFLSHLQPQGPNNLAAVRFSSPIRVSKLRIFPIGVPLFENAPHIKSMTSPEAFYLDVFFNAQPVGSDGKDKQRAANALVPTSVSYPGGLMDFAVDMGTEYATRLMIVKGSFHHISLAIYGSIVSEQFPVLTYQPKTITPLEPEPLSTHFDPAHASDPTALAKSLLELVPNAPSLSLAVRLMFCLKPTEDDWDNPDFPHIYANLENDSEDYDLDSIVANLDRPIPEDVSQESLDRFVERLTDFVESPSVDLAYQIANVLNLSASQSPLFSQALLNALDLSSLLTATTLADTPTLKTLTDACSNALIARHFLNQTTLFATLSEMRDNPRFRSDKSLLSAIDRLKSRILGWQAFEDALSRENGSDDWWTCPAGLLYDICREEQALGNWLASMIMHDDILDLLAKSPPPPQSTSTRSPPILFSRNPDEDGEDGDEEFGPIEHHDFIAFVRACIGVVAVLGVLAWADSVGNDDCRERTLAVIHLWQSTDGYREIVNHLFLLRQLTRRLKWITTDNDPPRHSGLLAERVLCSLLLPSVPSSHPYPHPYPHSHTHIHNHSQPTLPALNHDLTQTILSLSQPLAYIPEHERLGFRKLALVVDDGLPAAVEELVLVFNSHRDAAEDGTSGMRRPLSLRRIRILRVGVGLVLRELGNDGSGEVDTDADGGGDGVGGEWRVLEAFGVEKTFGFIERLVDLLGDLVEDLQVHCFHGDGINSLPNSKTTSTTGHVPEERHNQDLIEQLFATTHELLILIHRLAIKAIFSLTARGLRKVVYGIVDLIGCADSVLSPITTYGTPINGTSKLQKKGRAQRQTGTERVARKTRKTCVRVLRAFARRDAVVEPRKRTNAMEVVLRSLLLCGQVGHHGGEPSGSGKEEDVVGRVERVLELIECVLPSSPSPSPSTEEVRQPPQEGVEHDQQMVDSEPPTHIQNQRQLQQLKDLKALWATSVFPLILHELRLFMCVLPVEAQVRLVLLLVGVDEEGCVGVGEWLVEEVVKEVVEVVRWLQHVGNHSLEEFDDGKVEEGIAAGAREVTVGEDPKEEGEGRAMEGVEGVEEKKGEKDKFTEEQRRRREVKVQKQREREVLRAERMVNLYRVYTGLQFLSLLASSSTSLEPSSSWFLRALVQTPTLATYLTSLLTLLLDGHYTSPPITSLLKSLSHSTSFAKLTSDNLKAVVLVGALRNAQGDVTSVIAGDGVKDMIGDEGVKRVMFSASVGANGGQDISVDVDVLRLEVGRLCAVCADRVGMVSTQVAEMLLAVLAWMTGASFKSSAEATTAGENKEEERPAKMKVLRGVTREAFIILCDSFTIMLPEEEQVVHDLQARMGVDEDEDFTPIPIELPDTLVLSLSSISSLLSQSRTVSTPSSSSHSRTRSLSTLQFSGGFPSGGSVNYIDTGRPSTPKGGQKTPDILGTIISPPTALLRSPAATGLTKTYMNNDFRSLRQVPSARLNTSRLPSTHGECTFF
ncbi:hypothetical protein D9756_000256 [Leucocoprinus leucothites]|uniref:Virilizer N-terminal domain-containing protein n=1 Tax=Leucocoprinus leucothites TaxID=201217 RepID=A0A8H5GFF1_9AGAR|nr:hypothetical protein D9756_000256 [Leucoagaricus leucothites]